MPKYLAKDYLNEHVQQAAEVLRCMLMTVPKDLEFTLNYFDNCLYVDTGAIKNPLKDFATDQDEFKNNYGANTKQWIFCVEEYVEHCEKIHENIIQIDSDLDCGISSSFGSSVSEGSSSIKNEIVKCVFKPSLCSRELPEISKLLLEEIEDCFEIPSTSLSSLVTCLRPVKISDPFAMQYFIGLSKLVLEFVPKSEKLDRISEREVLQFEKEVLSENDLFIENYINRNMNEKPLMDVKNTLNQFPKITDTVSELNLKWSTCGSLTYPVEFFIGENQLVADNMEPMDVDTPNNQRLESPFSDVDSIFCSFLELPDMCLQLEELNNDNLTILTPSSRLKAEQSLREADKRYDEILLLLLPVIDEPVVICDKFPLFPANILKERHLNLSENEFTLDWDPMSTFNKEMKLAEESVITATNREKVSSSFDFTFSKDIFPKEGDDKVINWKFKGKIFPSLQHLTSYKNEDVKSLNDQLFIANKYKTPIYSNHLKTQVETTLFNTSVKMMCSTPKVYQSPLDSFMMLRTGRFDPLPSTKKVKAFVKPVVTTVSAAKVQPMCRGIEKNDMLQANISSYNSTNYQDVKKNPNFGQTKKSSFDISNLADMEKSYLIKHQIKNKSGSSDFRLKDSLCQQATMIVSKCETKVLDVHLSAEYISILNVLEHDSWSVLQVLKNFHLIDKSVYFFNITPDFSRFLLKQEEQNVEKGVLKGFGEEKKTILGNILVPIQQKLAKFHCQYEEANILHPKFIAIYKLVAGWLKSDFHSKILILVHRCYGNLSHRLKTFLDTDKSLSVNFYPQEDVCEVEYMSRFSDANIILAAENEEMLSCPWEYFQYIIQFEHRLESHWHEIIIESNPELRQFVSLNVLVGSSQENVVNPEIFPFNNGVIHVNKSKDKSVVNKLDLSVPTNPISIYTQHYVLCCKDAVKDKDLLITLESKENVIVVTKDYAKLKNFTDFYFHPDILLDERTGVLILDANNTVCVIKLEVKVLSLVLKCSSSHIILTNYSNALDSTIIFSQIILIVTRITQLFKVSIKLHHVFSVQQLASLIRLLCDSAKQASTVWENDQWISRQWIKEDFSKEEEFLLSYPFINSFCAQLMLKVVDSLSILLQYSLLDLKELLKWIPQHIIVAFYNASHNVETFIHQTRFDYKLDDVQKHDITLHYPIDNPPIINTSDSLLDVPTNDVRSKYYLPGSSSNSGYSLVDDTPVNNTTSRNYDQALLNVPQYKNVKAKTNSSEIFPEKCLLKLCSDYHSPAITPIKFKTNQTSKKMHKSATQASFSKFDDSHLNDPKWFCSKTQKWTAGEIDVDKLQTFPLKCFKEKEFDNNQKIYKNFNLPQEEYFSNNATKHSSQLFNYSIDLCSTSNSNVFKEGALIHSPNLPFINLASNKHQSNCYQGFNRNTKEHSLIKNCNIKINKPLWSQPSNISNLPRQAVKAIQVQDKKKNNEPQEIFLCLPHTSKEHFKNKQAAFQSFKKASKGNSSNIHSHRSEEDLTKKCKLSYERVPGATNGQTRLKFL